MGSVTKIPNGGTVIVRTGVLQGVGPVGPTGPRGFQGPQGPMGEQGPVGPTGHVVEYLTEGSLNSATAIASGATVQVPFAAVTDELDAFQSTTNLTPGSAGIYQVNLFAGFSAPANSGDGYRSLWFYKRDGVGTETILGIAQVGAAPTEMTYLSVSCVFEREDGYSYHVKAKSTDDVAVAVTEARITMNRIGAGMQGPLGPAGPQGPVGPVGPQGIQGNPGSADDGFATFEDLRP